MADTVFRITLKIPRAALTMMSARWTQVASIDMPPKVRELVAQLEGAGFANRGGKESHRNFVHADVSRPVTLSGKLSDDAKPYQILAVKKALAELKR